MSGTGARASATTQWDFFLTYAAEDLQWAEWLAWQLEAAHYRVLIQAWDFVPGSNWTARMQQGAVAAERTIAVLSSAYLSSFYEQPEWQAAVAADPSGFARKLLPIRIEDCDQPGLLKPIASIDLFGQAADTARATLLSLVRHAVEGRAKPATEPTFPPTRSTVEPDFPGPAPTETGLTPSPPANRAVPEWPPPAQHPRPRPDDRQPTTAGPACNGPGGAVGEPVPPGDVNPAADHSGAAPRPAKADSVGAWRRARPETSAGSPAPGCHRPTGLGDSTVPEYGTTTSRRPLRRSPRIRPDRLRLPGNDSRSWAAVPTDRLVYLSGAAGSVVRASLSPLPEDAPAIVVYRPLAGRSVTAMQASLVAELESVAVRLFPSWLPGAEVIDGPGGASVAAVRALAARAAATSAVFAPYLEDLAERSLSGRPIGARFSSEVRAAGVARTIATSFGRKQLALLVDLPQHSEPRQEHALVAALEWFAYKGHAGVWLTDGPLLHSDRVPAVAAPVTGEPTPSRAGRGVPAAVDGVADDPPDAVESRVGIGHEPGGLEPTRIELPAITGRPHPASRAEERLERALTTRPWAHGRAWNHPHRSGPLAGLLYLDLVWLAERLVIEVDGPEHRGIAHYDQDRRRDTELVLDGFTVLRFTNNQVLDDVDAVVGQIKRCVEARRSIQEEALKHGTRRLDSSGGRDTLGSSRAGP